jgi:hypothetical protein
MPFGDRTGPSGLGPMTGRGAGFCAGGRGGRGWRNRFRATGLTGRQSGARAAAALGREQEVAALKAQAERFESALGEIRKRIEDLETPPKQQ